MQKNTFNINIDNKLLYVKTCMLRCNLLKGELDDAINLCATETIIKK